MVVKSVNKLQHDKYWERILFVSWYKIMLDYYIVNNFQDKGSILLLFREMSFLATEVGFIPIKRGSEMHF